MNTEQTSSVEDRARRHAALGDPVRLRVVDLLLLGDASPLTLQSELGLTSNLMAHHLRVLEDSGVVSRHRSEADRRRSYVALRPEAFGELAPVGRLPARRVVFVCTANTARSQLAALLWGRASDVPAASAGTHPAERIAPGAFAVARRHGLDLPDVAPRGLAEVAEDGDLLVTVCDRAHEDLAAPGLHWSVPDPVATGSRAAFDRAYDELAHRIEAVAPRVTAA